MIERGWQGFRLFETAVSPERCRVLLLPGLYSGGLQFLNVAGDAALLGAGITSIAVTPPGFGGNPPGGHPLALEAYAKSVEGLIEAERIDVAVGYSYFANVLIELAASGRTNIPLVLVSPSLSRKCEMRVMRVLDRISRYRPVGVRLIRGAIDAVSKETSAIDPVSTAVPAAEESRATIAAHALAVTQEYFDHLRRRGDCTEALAGASNPVWYVRGDRDAIAFPEHSRARLTAGARFTLCEVPGATHALPMTHGPELAQIIARVPTSVLARMGARDWRAAGGLPAATAATTVRRPRGLAR